MVQSAALVDVPRLQRELAGDRPPVLLDVRWSLGGPAGATEYAQGHLPGAVFVDLETQLSRPRRPGEGRHPLPDPEVLQEALRAAGVHEDTPVVVHDAADSTSAARAWWVLRWAGLGDVRVLDGGLAAWTAHGGPLTTDVSRPVPGDVVVRPGALPVLDAGALPALTRTGVLLDVRAPERYRGEAEPVDPVAGHVPGARNLPTTQHVTAAGTFDRPEQLRARFDAAGVRPGVEVGVYCGSGVTAAHTLLALEVAGLSGTLYPGSWSEWITDLTRPVATGPDPDDAPDDDAPRA
ncbi:sulfurtransferase [Kineococcus sp. SYSU DK001]|uniref:sulfurtransferase n=1 Tax=Kineococcus sp. SYSU DK001 TaxID=3383122 RepID=UPI003D7DC6C7